MRVAGKDTMNVPDNTLPEVDALAKSQDARGSHGALPGRHTA